MLNITPNEATILGYMLQRGTVSDSQIQNQFCISSGILLTIARSLKTKLLIEQEGRYYRATLAAEQVLQPQPAPQPFAGQPAW